MSYKQIIARFLAYLSFTWPLIPASYLTLTGHPEAGDFWLVLGGLAVCLLVVGIGFELWSWVEDNF